MIRLIVNADDFGLSSGVNAGIVDAHERGIVTSASLMVKQGEARQAAEYARRQPALGLGLHVDLGEWALREGTWHALYERVPAGDARAVEAEAREQLALFRDLAARDPDHLDSHQHVHRREPARTVLRRLAADLGVTLRHAGRVRYCGRFYGQSDDGTSRPEWVAPAALLAVLDELPAGITELACHPGRVVQDDPLGGTMYRIERGLELAALCDPHVRDRVVRRGIVLCTFRDCARATKGKRK